MQAKYKFLCINFLLHVIALVYVAFIIYETNKYMYFAGFGSLFILILLIPYFLILFHIMLLLLLSIKFKQNMLMVVTLILQIICSLFWILMVYLFQSAISWFEVVILFQIITAITILLLIRENHNT